MRGVVVLAGAKPRGEAHGENPHSPTKEIVQSSDDNNMIVEEEAEELEENSSVAQKMGEDLNVACIEEPRRDGEGRPTSSQRHHSPIRAKNILLCPSSMKNKKEGWKRRARMHGRSQDEGGGRNTVIGSKRKTTEGKKKVEQSQPKRVLIVTNPRAYGEQQNGDDTHLAVAAMQHRQSL